MAVKHAMAASTNQEQPLKYLTNHAHHMIFEYRENPLVGGANLPVQRQKKLRSISVLFLCHPIRRKIAKSLFLKIKGYKAKCFIHIGEVSDWNDWLVHLLYDGKELITNVVKSGEIFCS
jgi:hypothetical protein